MEKQQHGLPWVPLRFTHALHLLTLLLARLLAKSAEAQAVSACCQHCQGLHQRCSRPVPQLIAEASAPSPLGYSQAQSTGRVPSATALQLDWLAGAGEELGIRAHAPPAQMRGGARSPLVTDPAGQLQPP